VAPSGVTDAAGHATATVTAGPSVGPVSVTATRQDAPGVSVTFNLTVSNLGTLAIVAGDDQLLAAGVPSAPLEVELTDADGTPIAGATIDWTTTAGTLASATSVTDASGIATNTVTTNAAGAIEVTASSPLAAAPAVFGLNGRLSNLGGLDPVQTQVVEAVDNLCPALAALAVRTPAQNDLLARCRELIDAGGIDPDATLVAIDELMSDVALAQGNAAFLALQAQFHNLKTRIAALRSGTQGTSFGGLAINTSTGPMSLETLSTAFNADEDEAAAAAGEAGTDFSRWGFFASGTIGRGESDEGQVNPEFDYDIEGVTAGVDYRKGDNWIFGAAFGLTRQDTTLPGGKGGVETSGWTLSAYSTYYTPDSWYADGVLTVGRNDYDMVRHIDYTVPTPGGGSSTISQLATASSGGDLLSAAFTVGRDFNRGAFGFGPYARVLYTRVGFDAIEEEMISGLPGSGLGLRIEERELTSLASQIGGKLTYTHSTDWGVLMPHLQLEWEHEFKDDPQSVEARFLHDPTGTGIFVRGDDLDTDYFRIGLGLSMVLTRGRSGFVYYEHLLGRDGFSQWNLALGLRLEF
jgi:outer membrane autotransporter protein